GGGGGRRPGCAPRAPPAVVDVGGVEEDDPALDRAPHDRLRRLLVERPRPVLVRAEAHHPEADAGDTQARPAEVHVLHGRKLSADGGYLRERGSAITAAASSRIGGRKG